MRASCQIESQRAADQRPRLLLRIFAGHRLSGGGERKALFKGFCSGYRIYRHASKNHVSLVFENVDLDKMRAMMDTPETSARKAAHTVIEPIEIYIEVEGAT